MKYVLTIAALFLANTAGWAASTVNITKMINGDGIGDTNPGEVTTSITNGICTLTVTPAADFYATLENITVYATVSGSVAQGTQRAPSINEGQLQVTATNSSADPSGETTYTFTMPNDESIVEVTVDFQYRTSISDAEVTLAKTSMTYTGVALEPAVSSVTQGSDVISSDNYTVTYSNNTDVGTATVTVTGIGMYTGTTTTTFEITKAAAAITEAPAAVSGLTYSGAAQTLITAGTATGGTLKYSTDNNTFSADLPTGTDAGEYNVYYKVEGDANHNDLIVETPITVNIAKATGDLTVTITDGTATFTYTGEEFTPAVTVKSGNTTLTEKKDYTVAYASNTNVGTATITVTGAGNYEGATGSISFTITKADAAITKEPTAVTGLIYSGAAQTLITAGTATGGTLKYSTDNKTFSAELPTGTDAGDYNVYYKVEGDANHTDIKSTQIAGVAITQADLSIVTIAAVSDQTYTGAEITPEPAVTLGDYTLTKDTDFTYSYANNTNVPEETSEAQPTITVTAVAGGNFKGTATLNFNITAKSIETLTISEIGTQTYTGQAITPAVTVKDGETTLTKDTDYTVEYSNNTAVGTATVTITGNGNYKGSVSINFIIIEDVAGEISKAFSKSQKYGTFIFKQTLTVPSGVKAYVITGIDLSTRTVSVSDISYLPAGIPVLLEKTGTEIGASSLYTGATSDVTCILQSSGESGMKVDVNDVKSYYVLYKDEYVKVTRGTTIAANRYYLTATSANAPSRLMIIDGESDVTAITELSTFNVKHSTYYDLQGRRIIHPVKGQLYIVNGKKVVIR